MKTPCDEALVLSNPEASPCVEAARPWVLAATILGSSMAFIDSTVANVALPALQRNFGATVSDVQWVVEAYGLTLGALILVGGAVGDMYGRRITFFCGVLLFGLSSAWCGLATNIHQLVSSRAIQGIGAAFLVPGSLALISANFPTGKRGRAIGTWSGFTAITMAVGPVLGGWLIQHASWRWAFFLNLPIAAAVLLITFWRVPESRNQNASRSLDWAGALTATLGLGGVVYALIESSVLGWRNAPVWMSAGIGAGSLVAFYWVEHRTTNPMLPFRLFHLQTFLGANLLTLFLYAALGEFFFVVPLNLIQIQHYSPTAAGAAILPVILLTFSLARWSGGLVDRFGARRPLILGPMICAAGFGLCALVGSGQSYWTNLFPVMIVLGLGLAITVAPLTTTVMGAVGPQFAGTASGINNAVSRVAGLLSIAVLGIVLVTAFNWRLDRELKNSSLPENVQRELSANRSKLAGMTVPANTSPELASRINAAIATSFLSGFRLVLWFLAGLAIASSAFAWRMIGEKQKALLSRNDKRSVQPNRA
jgi:EmrB/QacA subfamily drug resistance transporter